MWKYAFVFAFLVSSAAAALPGWLELGVVGCGGLTVPVGGYFGAKTSQLAALGASGQTRIRSLPQWGEGLYATMDVLPWLSVGLEPRVSFRSASSLSSTDAGKAFDLYAVSFASGIIPATVTGKLTCGPGDIGITAGGYYGVVIGSVTFLDRYASVTTTASATGAGFWGLTAGAGYSLDVGPLRAGLSLRVDWTLTSIVPFGAGQEITPVDLSLMFALGIRGAQR